MTPACSHCGRSRTYTKGLCRNCYQYRRRHGTDRPQTLIEEGRAGNSQEKYGSVSLDTRIEWAKERARKLKRGERI